MLSALLATTLLMAALDDVKPSPEDLAAYASAKETAGRDAASQVKLALWCEAHGLKDERATHLRLALLNDSSNPAARGLLGLMADGGKWARPDELAEKVRRDSALAESLAEYSRRRLKAPRTAEGQWKLALWCEENQLDAEAKAHLVACVRLDPGRASAWKKLGCRRDKPSGRWMTDEQIAARKAEAEAQQKADKHFKAQLIAWRAGLRDRDPNKRFEAEKGLDSLKDPRAVASVWRVFVKGGGTPGDIARAVQLLGQIDAPASSRALAMIALDASSSDLRRTAVETVARRDPRDYMGELIALLRDELRWEVRPVGGPQSPGILFVEGQEFNRMRVYTPPAMNLPVVDPWAGMWTTDADGFAEVHLLGQTTATRDLGPVATFGGAMPGDVGSPVGKPSAHAPSAKELGQTHRPGSVHKQETDVLVTDTTIPIGRMMEENRRAALASQEQLRQDIAAVEAENAKTRAHNARVVEVLNNATNQALRAKRDDWRRWWADQRGYAYAPPPPVPKPTLVEDAPNAYMPAALAPTMQVGGAIDRRVSYVTYADCFAAGTPVRTRDGARPIESLEVGDHVLAQDMTTGALAYKPILAVFKFRPAETIKVTFDGETLLTTAVHRFWRLGEGWVMARDLKPGDTVRTLGGTARVERIEKDVVRQVFNLEVADCADYFVGKGAILAGDNSRMGTRTRPFDAPGPLSALAHRPTK